VPIHPLEPKAKYPFCDFVGTEKGFAQNKRKNSSSSLAMNLLLSLSLCFFVCSINSCFLRLNPEGGLICGQADGTCGDEKTLEPRLRFDFHL